MNKLYNFLRGSAKVEIDGAYTEQFINGAAKREIKFWDYKKTAPDKATLCVPQSAARFMEAVADESQCTVKTVKMYGIPQFIYGLRKRWVLFAGLALCLLAVPVLSLFVWEIDVSGNTTVTDGEILSKLDQLGVHIGMFGLDIDQQDIRSHVLGEIKELSWITVNVVGTKAEVIVRERVKKPELVDINQPTEVVSTKSGVIARMYVYQGKPMVAEGSTVAKGDVLVSSLMTSLKSGDRYVHAAADIYARTWYELSSEMPLQYEEKEYTGESDVKHALIIAGKRINLYLKSGFSDPYCDKIVKTKKLVLPGGYTLPIALATEQSKVYEPSYKNIDKAEAEEILRSRLMGSLKKMIDGTVSTSEFETEINGGTIKVTLRAECREQIAEIRKIS